MKPILRNIGIIFLTILVLGVIGFVAWAGTPYQPEPVALESIDRAAVETGRGWLVFDPEDTAPSTGLILYPGGRVDYRAYAPQAEAIADHGYKVVLVPMPLNFAIFGLNRANEVIAAFPDIKAWAVGGHSLGGAMAAEYVKSSPPSVKGLVLWAAYPANDALRDSSLEVISIYASNDQVATIQEINESKMNLPEDTIFVGIEGGNHAGFGWYGPQSGDGILAISRKEQQAQVVAGTAAFLEDLVGE